MYCNSGFLRHGSFAGKDLQCWTGEEIQILPAALAGTRGRGDLSNEAPSHQTIATARPPGQYDFSSLLWERKEGRWGKVFPFHLSSETPAGLQASDLGRNSLYCSIHPCLIHLMKLLNGTQAIGWLSTEMGITSLITRYGTALIISTVLKKFPPRGMSFDLF